MKKPVSWLLMSIGIQCLSQGQPSVELTSVPGWGQSTLLQGQVHHVSPSDHRIAVYIFVEEAGGWWTKPYASEPLTIIRPDSGFSTNIVIGGLDEFATKIIAFLIPSSFSPPVILGAGIPDTMFSFPSAVSCRPHGSRVITWSGYEWIVKRSVGTALLPIGPGPNIFNDNDTMVWVDGQQRLHLRIARNGNNWHCSELICQASLGYRRYNFEVGSRLDLLDSQIIAGIFTWDDCSPYVQPPDAFFREIDLEFSRWGNPGNLNSQFVVQPFSIPGNIERFDMNLAGTGHSGHFFDWKADSIVFSSTWGSSSHSWTFTDPARIPVPGNENIRINLHLLNGMPPSDQADAEIILNTFITGNGAHRAIPEYIKVFPNPFELYLEIEVVSDKPKDLKIQVMDLRGNIIRSLFTGRLNTGSNLFRWDGSDDNGTPVRPGLYIVCCRDKDAVRYLKIIFRPFSFGNFER